MPAIRIPVTKGVWRGQYQGEYYGDFRRTFGLDLERNQGKIELSERHNMVFSDTGDSDFRRVEAFVRSNLSSDSGVRWYATAFDGFDTVATRYTIFRSTDSNGDTGWAADTYTFPGGTKFTAQDLVSFPQTNQVQAPNRLFATTGDTQVIYKPGTAGDTAGWQSYANGLSILDSGIFHPLDVFEGTLLVGNLNSIHTLDNTDSVIIADRVLIPAEYSIHHIFHTPTRSWLLAANANMEGMISEWDGFSTFPIKNHKIGGIPLTGVDYYGVPIILTSRGQFLELNATSFTPIRDFLGNILALPVDKQNDNSLLGALSYPIDPSKFAVARRGMIVDGENIKFNLARSRTEVLGGYKQNSGIWVLNPTRKVLYNSSSMGSDDNLGHGFARRSGALLEDWEGGIRFGSGRFHDNFDTTNRSVICLFNGYDDTSIQRGFFESQWINTPQADASWMSVWVKHKKFADTNVKILAKACIEDGPTIMDSDIDLYGIAQVDFDDDTAFQVQLSSTLSDSLVVGDEIEVLAGPNAGKLAHITAISGAHGAVQTITIDESFDSSASLSAATFRRWVKLTLPTGDSAITHGDSEVVHQFIIPGSLAHAPKISVKLEMRGRVRDVSIEELALEYKVSEEFED